MSVRRAIKKNVKRQVKKAVKKSYMVDLFVPGLGTVVRSVAKKVDGLTGSQKRKFYSLRTKKEKMNFLKSIK